MICEDDRQWVPAGGQRWTTLEAMAADGYRSEVREVEPGLMGVGAEPLIGIGQRGWFCAPTGQRPVGPVPVHR
ncbi:hypothetical protein NKH18_49595 [Streptomyces sp. M10(2022)]